MLASDNTRLKRARLVILYIIYDIKNHDGTKSQ